jgi:hypothetical protein
VTYALWSGIGIVLVTVIAWFAYGQVLDGPHRRPRADRRRRARAELFSKSVVVH